MGTRNLVCVRHDKKIKVAQYGQWDGYPSGQGKTIIEFLKQEFDREKFLKELDKIEWISEDKLKEYWDECGADGSGFVDMEVSKKFKDKYPELSRDTGAGVLSLIQQGKVKYLQDSFEFLKDTLFCEWAYIIDLDNNTLEVYDGGTQPRAILKAQTNISLERMTFQNLIRLEGD